MLNKNIQRILEAEICLSLLELRKRKIVRDLIPEQIFPNDLVRILQELSSVTGSMERAEGLSETDINVVQLQCLISLTQLNVLLIENHCLDLEEILGMEIDVEHVKEVLAAIARLLSQNKAPSIKRKRKESVTSCKRFKPDITEMESPATVTRKGTEVDEPDIITEKASKSTSKFIKASTSQACYSEDEKHDTTPASCKEIRERESELSKKKPATGVELSQREPEAGPELSKRELPVAGPELPEKNSVISKTDHVVDTRRHTAASSRPTQASILTRSQLDTAASSRPTQASILTRSQLDTAASSRPTQASILTQSQLDTAASSRPTQASILTQSQPHTAASSRPTQASILTRSQLDTAASSRPTQASILTRSQLDTAASSRPTQASILTQSQPHTAASSRPTQASILTQSQPHTAASSRPTQASILTQSQPHTAASSRPTQASILTQSQLDTAASSRPTQASILTQSQLDTAASSRPTQASILTQSQPHTAASSRPTQVQVVSSPSLPSSTAPEVLTTGKSKTLNKFAEGGMFIDVTSPVQQDPEQAKSSFPNKNKNDEVNAKHFKNDTRDSKVTDGRDTDDSDLEITLEEIRARTNVPTNKDNKFELTSPSQVTPAPMNDHIQDKSAEDEDHCRKRTNKKTKQVKSVRQQSTKSCLTQSTIQPAVKKCCLRLRCIETIEDYDNVKSFVINLPQYDKEQLIKKYVAATPCKTRSVDSKRIKNRTYYLPIRDCPKKVICKVAFMNLLGICSDFIDEVLKPDRNKMSNNNSKTQEECNEDQLAVQNLINTDMTENRGIIPSTVDEMPTVEYRTEDSNVSLKACQGDDKNSEPGGVVSHKTTDDHKEEVMHIQSIQQEPALNLISVSNTRGSTIYSTPWREQIHKTSTDILPSVTTSDIIAKANKAVLPDSIYQSYEQYERKNTIVKQVNTSLTGNIQFKENSPSQNEKSVPYSTQTQQSSDINNQNELPEFLAPSPYQKPVVNKSESINKLENDSDTPSPLPFSVSPGTALMASDLIQNDLPASPSVSSSYTSNNMYKSVYPGKPQAVVPPKKRPQPPHTTVGKRMHSVNDLSLNVTALQHYHQRVLTPEQVTEIQKICETKVLQLKEGQADYDVNIILQQIKNLHDLREISIWYKFVNKPILEELIKQQCNLKKLAIKSWLLHTVENISYIAQGLADQAGTVEELDISFCRFTGDQLKNVLNTQRNLTKLELVHSSIDPDEAKALPQGLSYTGGKLPILILTCNNIGSAAGDVSKALINHHKLCKLVMSGCMMEPDDMKALCEGLSQMKGSLEELDLIGNNVGSAAGDVSKALINHHKLCKLVMSGCMMEPDDMKALCEGLSQMKGSLEELNLSYNNVGSAAGNVRKALINHHKLCKLYMRQCEMEPDDVKALCEGLSQMKGSLEELNLSYNNVGSAAGDVSKALINHHKLCKLDMSRCWMEPDDVKALCEGLSQMKGSLEELNLSDNNVGSAAGDVSKALINHHKLCKLDMSECRMEPDDVKALCEGLSQMKGSLQELNLSGNNIGSAAGDVSKALINHHELCKLDMSWCNMEPDDVKALCEGLSQIKGSLQELNLSGNNIGSAAGDVSKALINHHKLCKLDMSGCKMKPDDVKALCEGLSQMKGSLEELNLRSNYIGSAAGDVSKALINHHKLCKLDMSECKMEPDDVKALCEGLSQIKGSLQELKLFCSNRVDKNRDDFKRELMKKHTNLKILW